MGAPSWGRFLRWRCGLISCAIRIVDPRALHHHIPSLIVTRGAVRPRRRRRERVRAVSISARLNSEAEAQPPRPMPGGGLPHTSRPAGGASTARGERPQAAESARTAAEGRTRTAQRGGQPHPRRRAERSADSAERGAHERPTAATVRPLELAACGRPAPFRLVGQSRPEAATRAAERGGGEFFSSCLSGGGGVYPAEKRKKKPKTGRVIPCLHLFLNIIGLFFADFMRDPRRARRPTR